MENGEITMSGTNNPEQKKPAMTPEEMEALNIAERQEFLARQHHGTRVDVPPSKDWRERTQAEKGGQSNER
jgi:hypothetical protein